MLFEKEFKEAEEKLYSKDCYVENMAEPCNEYYEVFDKKGKILMDYLSMAQLVQLANLLTV